MKVQYFILLLFILTNPLAKAMESDLQEYHEDQLHKLSDESENLYDTTIEYINNLSQSGPVVFNSEKTNEYKQRLQQLKNKKDLLLVKLQSIQKQNLYFGADPDLNELSLKIHTQLARTDAWLKPMLRKMLNPQAKLPIFIHDKFYPTTLK